jgi:hypothetical protein
MIRPLILCLALTGCTTIADGPECPSGYVAHEREDTGPFETWVWDESDGWHVQNSTECVRRHPNVEPMRTPGGVRP